MRPVRYLSVKEHLGRSLPSPDKNIKNASCCHSGLSGIFLANCHSSPVPKKDSGSRKRSENDRSVPRSFIHGCGFTSELLINLKVFAYIFSI